MYGLTTLQPSSSMETPTTANFLSRKLCSNSTNHGISSLHGTHQVAQKLSSTARPRKSESLTALPDESAKAKSGAIFRSRTLLKPDEVRPADAVSPEEKPRRSNPLTRLV